MKKNFFLAVALIAAVSVSAGGFDYRSTSMYTIDVNSIFTNLTNCTIVQTGAPTEGNVTGKNSINLTIGGTEASFSMGGVIWSYTNSTDGTTIAKQYGNYVQPNGKDRTITIPSANGESVIINVVESITAAGVTITGINETWTGFLAGDNTFTATGNVVITTSSEKPKFSAILYGSAAAGLANAIADSQVRFNGTEVLNPQGLNISVYNALGKMVATANSNIDMSQYANGVYIVRAAGVKGALKIQK